MAAPSDGSYSLANGKVRAPANYIYRDLEVVWARLYDFPWWPAQCDFSHFTILDVDHGAHRTPRLPVRWFGEDHHRVDMLTRDRVLPFSMHVQHELESEIKVEAEDEPDYFASMQDAVACQEKWHKEQSKQRRRRKDSVEEWDELEEEYEPTPRDDDDELQFRMAPNASAQPVTSKFECMDMNEMVCAAFTRMIHALKEKDPLGKLFNVVDLPAYRLEIKTPIHFGDILRRLKKRKYKRVCDIQKEILLLFNNWYAFNGPPNPRIKDDFSTWAQTLQNELDQHMQTLHENLVDYGYIGSSSHKKRKKEKELSKIDDDDNFDANAPCGVCWGSSSFDDDVLIYCDGCNVPLHQMCYLIPQIPEQDYYCKVCAYQMRTTGQPSRNKDWSGRKCKCSICQLRFLSKKLAYASQKMDDETSTALAAAAGSPLATKQKWCHLICAQFVSETWFDEHGTELDGVCNVEGIRQKRGEGQCGFCGREKGAKVFCSIVGCGARFHTSCGLVNGCMLQDVAEPDAEFSNRVVYCRAHLPSLIRNGHNAMDKKKLADSQDVRTNGNQNNLGWGDIWDKRLQQQHLEYERQHKPKEKAFKSALTSTSTPAPLSSHSNSNVIPATPHTYTSGVVPHKPSHGVEEEANAATTFTFTAQQNTTTTLEQRNQPPPVKKRKLNIDIDTDQACEALCELPY